jgi:hypothetical protein
MADLFNIANENQRTPISGVYLSQFLLISADAFA